MCLLAKKGFREPEILSGKYTIFNAFSGERHMEYLIEDLGRRYEILNLAFKKYSCCAFLHPALDALLKIIKDNEIRSADIEDITLRFPSSGAELIDRAGLRSHRAQYVLALAVVKGEVMIDDIIGVGDVDPKILELERRVKVLPDEELNRVFPETYASIVTVRTRDGNRFTERVDHAIGTPEPYAYRGNREEVSTPIQDYYR